MKRFLLIWTILSIILVAPAQERNASNSYSGANEHSQIARETHVTPAQALNVGYTFMRTGNNTRGNSVNKQTMQLIYTGRATDSLTLATTDCYYVFSLQPKGFVIVAADDRVEPILGYSYDNNFVVENMPDHVRGWLGNYEKQIEAVVKQNIAPEAETTTKWTRLKAGQAMSTRSNETVVGPLLTTTWDQGQYYNAMCPEDANGPDGHVLTGCVATAMAQIINYWGYPAHGRGSHSYNVSGLDPNSMPVGTNVTGYGTVVVHFDSATYDYNHMPDILTSESTQEEIDAIAQLMYHCGVAVNMFYDPFSCGAYEEDVRGALISYFGFAHTLGYAQKQVYTNEEWTDSLKANIDRGEPVFYCGKGSGAHAFVLDGYNEDDYFHFNFGWSGDCDGWFLTTAINVGFGFNEWQSAIMGIRPSNEEHAAICHKIMYVQNNDYFTVTEPIDLYPMRGGSEYKATNEWTGVRINLNLVPEDSLDQLVLDILDFGNEQSVVIYDGINQDSLVRVIETRGFSNYDGLPTDSIFQNMASVDLSPVVSTRHGLTVVAYSYGGIPESFHLRVSDASDCRMVSNLTAIQDVEGVLVSWTENGDATQWQVKVGESLYATDSTHLLLTHLTPNTSHTIQVRAVCGDGNYSPWNNVSLHKKDFWKDIVTSEPESYYWDGDTIRITSAEGLAWLARRIDNGTDDVSFYYSVISIEEDLDLSGHLWSPIQAWWSNVEGHGHIVSNMDISTSGYGGLFSTVNNAKISNLGFKNAWVNSIYPAGPLAGYIQNCQVDNCWSVNHIVTSGNSQGGGLIGRADYNSKIINCYAYGDVIAQFGYGGLVGVCNNSDIHNCVTRLGDNFNWRSYIYPAEYRGLLTEEVSGGSFSNCFSDISNAKWYNTNPETYRYYFLGNIYNVDAIENLATFNISIDSMGMLIADTAINYTLGENVDVITALNNKVAEYNSPNFSTWIRDSITHLPVFGNYYEVTCPNVSNITAENIVYNNGFAVALSWQEEGEAENWQIKYNLMGAPDDSATVMNTNTVYDTIEGLLLGNDYVFYVRPICGGEDTVGWGQPLTFHVDKTLWVDMVTECPEGYSEDSEGNVTISSPEGLAWLAKMGFNGRNNTITIANDLDMGAYKWTPIGRDLFEGTIEGNNHVISNIYCDEGSSGNIGLIAHAQNANFNNIVIQNSSFTGFVNVGSLVGYLMNGTVKNCHANNVTVKGVQYVGGLGGFFYGSCETRNCSSSGYVYADLLEGGLIGEYNGTITNCYSNCCVRPMGTQIRFIYGELLGTAVGIVENCYGSGDVEAGTNDAWDAPVGRLVGSLDTGKYLYARNNSGLPFVEGEFISDTASFNNAGVLNNTVTIGETSYTNILAALNAWVDANDTAGVYRHWAVDSTGVNGGFPVFAAPQSYTLTLAIDITTPYGEVNGGGTYNEFETAIIHATAQEGYHFVQWNDGNTDNPRAVVLTNDSTLTAQFGVNMYSVVGTTSTSVDYFFDFEDVSEDDKWTFLNDNFTNRWYINMLDDNRALYISNDYGTSNDYDEYEQSSVFAYTTLLLDSGQYNFSYDWRCNAEPYSDYLRVALIPNSVTLDNTQDNWTPYSLPNDAISLDNEYQLAGQSAWVNQSGTIEVNATDEYKMVFYWHNDHSVKNMPPAAVDNIHLYNDGVDCSAMGTVLGSDTVPYLDTVMLTAVPNPGYRFVQWDDGNTDNPRMVVATNNKKFVAIFECLPITGTDSIVTCDSYSWKGVDYFESIVLIDTLTNVAGCDSVVTLHLTITNTDHTDFTDEACDSYTWNGETYTQSGDYTQTFTNSAGCDSVVTLHLTVNYSNTGDTTAVACESFTWQGTPYTESGSYSSYQTTAAGCDSIVTLHLTINQPVSTTVTETACESFTWNGTEYTLSGDYTYSHADANGCTQVDTLHLTINNPVHTAATETACESFTWNGTVYTVSGDYTFSHTDANGCTQVDTLHLSINNPIHTTANETACESFTWNGTTYTVSGDYTYSHPDANGCTQVDTLHLTINNPVHTAITETACESFTWNGTTYTVSGDYTYSHADGNGCTQVDTLHLTIFNDETSEFTITTPDSCYTWNSQTYCASGDYTQTLQTIHGCDSVVTLHLTITVGVDNYDGFDFKVYPNPTSNIVNVECIMKNEEWGGMELHLCDAYGRLLDVVETQNFASLQTAQIDLSRYANGVYFLKAVADRKTVAVRKVVKQ